MTQHQLILDQLRRRWLTPLDALNTCGTMKLSTRIGELRMMGHLIADRWVDVGQKRVKAYKLLKVK